MNTFWFGPQTWTLFFKVKRKGGKPECPEKNPPKGYLNFSLPDRQSEFVILIQKSSAMETAHVSSGLFIVKMDPGGSLTCASRMSSVAKQQAVSNFNWTALCPTMATKITTIFEMVISWSCFFVILASWKEMIDIRDLHAFLVGNRCRQQHSSTTPF